MDIDNDTRGKQYKTYKQLMKDHDILQNYVVKCKCSHTILFTGIKDRLICSHCGSWVYKNKKVEMRYKMKELLKKWKLKENIRQ